MENEKVEVIKGCSDDDLMRIWSLLRSTSIAVDEEIYRRKLGCSVVKHNSKKLTIQYISSDEEIEVDFKEVK